MSRVLTILREHGVLSPLDHRLALALGRLAEEPVDPWVLVAAALASRAPSHGHGAVDLAGVGALLSREHGDSEEPLPAIPFPDATTWSARLVASRSLVREHGEGRRAPLVLDDGLLYLERAWEQEVALVEALSDRLRAPPPELDSDVLREGLARLHGGDPRRAGQVLASAVACLRRLAVVTGGPGTGKTTAVTGILALLAQLAEADGRPWPRVLMVAPTGKAAARLTEAVAHLVADPAMVPVHLAEAVRVEASTIHRALGGRRLVHDRDNPLPADVVVVDEASMVGLSLMSRLVDAVPPGARLILLGDPDQLQSVEHGAVLGDICASLAGPRSSALAEDLAWVGVEVEDGHAPEPTPADAHVHLTHTWRFSGALGQLAAAIQAGSPQAVLALLDGPAPEVRRLEPGDPGLDDQLRAEVVARFSPVVRQTDPEAALAALGAFRVLCVHRRGPRGVHPANDRISAWLSEVGPLVAQPVMITSNDRATDLYNGDTGLVITGPEGERRAWFPGPEGARGLPPALLPDHELVFSTTVHKAQGSEHDRVLVVLPEPGSPLLSRELLYTAVTRARVAVTLYGSEAAVREAVHTRGERVSGLRRRLRGLWRP